MTAVSTPLLHSDLPGIPLVNRGKVRDVYKVDDERLLFVASDRISAFDVVMPNGIPDKGRILTQISLFWFNRLPDLVRSHVIRTHLISANTGVYPPLLRPFRAQLDSRSMLVRKLKIVPIECIVRGYLSGSGWKEYRQSGTICGIALPAGLRESDRLPEPIFTPSTKADSGHDINISPVEAANIVGEQLATALAEYSLAIYRAAADYARMRGIIIADTKFEFGLDEGGNLLLADEVLTPDSSRFWDVERYEPGRPQDSFDKQFVRDYLETLDWDKEPPGPELPDDVVLYTREKYLEAYRRLTGKAL
ncbi:MAG TPA: phosphoribosylaminoimidazolesuccinocarboxamide synthase [Armatimonadota bacterium]|nr:phosphoribosylaminoimidazolesuccinocarboxamide synthase [Armatimonadota bacterium]HOS42411.1 phosphoribosylaminoimidazolesuccinocarboxamide synthase [Armatimonadota bacterium]